MTRRNRWEVLQAWIASPDGDWFVDAAVLGFLPAYEADEVLEDYGLEASTENRRELARRVDAAAVAA
jgi:hypothetical protein